MSETKPLPKLGSLIDQENPVQNLTAAIRRKTIPHAFLFTGNEGVGKRTAEAIVLHLKDKVKRFGVSTTEIAEDDADVIAALTALGFSIVEAQRALQQLPRDQQLSIDEKIRQALAMLGK